jgi:MoxR-like ATPase
MNALQLADAQQAAMRVHASDALLDYLQRIVAASRSGQWFVQGLSPRAAISLLRAAKAFAYLAGHGFASPDDVKAVALSVMAHRLSDLPSSTRTTEQQLAVMLASIPL